jgi:hypothetical protein
VSFQEFLAFSSLFFVILLALPLFTPFAGFAVFPSSR